MALNKRVIKTIIRETIITFTIADFRKWLADNKLAVPDHNSITAFCSLCSGSGERNIANPNEMPLLKVHFTETVKVDET